MTDRASPDHSRVSGRPSAPPRRSLLLLMTDAVLVVIFAVLGNAQHESGLSPADVWATAWPFLLGLAVGWWITFSWRSPSTLWPHGVLLVLFVVTGGMMMRHLFTDGGVETSFVVVAALVLGALLLGRRLATAHPLPRQVT